MKEKIVLVGGGAHAKVVCDALESAGKFSILGIVDPKLPKGSLVEGVAVLGADDVLPKVYKEGVQYAFISIASIGDCSIRLRICAALKKIGFTLPAVIHKRSIVAKSAIIEEGAFVAAGAIVNPGAKIGRNAIINTAASIDHDCVIGSFAHVAPGAVLCGGVKVGDQTHIGSGATVIQNISIGKNCIVGAGITVRHNIGDGKKYLAGKGLFETEDTVE